MKSQPETAALAITPSQTVGPFFRVCLAADAEHGQLLTGETPRITLAVRVVDGGGAAVDDALVEIWQTAPDGGPCAFGRLATSDTGWCEFETTRPPVPFAGAAHINVCLFARGLLHHLFTRIYFDGDERLSNDPVLALVPEARRPTLAAHADPTTPGRWIFDIRLQGDHETVFFDA